MVMVPPPVRGSKPNPLVTSTSMDPPETVAEITSAGRLCEEVKEPVKAGTGAVWPLSNVQAGPHRSPKVRLLETGSTLTLKSLPLTTTPSGRSSSTPRVVSSTGILPPLIDYGDFSGNLAARQQHRRCQGCEHRTG